TTTSRRGRGGASEHAELRYPNILVTRAAPAAVAADGPTCLFRRSSPASAPDIVSDRESFAPANGSSRLDLLTKSTSPLVESQNGDRPPRPMQRTLGGPQAPISFHFSAAMSFQQIQVVIGDWLCSAKTGHQTSS